MRRFSDQRNDRRKVSAGRLTSSSFVAALHELREAVRPYPLLRSSGGMKGADWPGLKNTKEESMISLKFTFSAAASCRPGVSTFTLALIALAIDDDRQRDEERRRKKRDRVNRPPRPC